MSGAEHTEANPERSAGSRRSSVQRRAWQGACVCWGIAFTLAARLNSSMTEIQARRPDSSDPLAGLFGGGRKLFANHFFEKADVYFHSG